MALISWSRRWPGKVPDMGVMMGEEMLISRCFLSLRGERRKERNELPRDSDLLSLFRSRPAGLLFRRALGGGAMGEEGMDELFLGDAARDGGGSYTLPCCFASSCSITYLYMSSNCDCAMALSCLTT